MQTKIEVTAVVTDEVVAIEVNGVDRLGEVAGWSSNAPKATGWAKKHPKDEPNTDISFNLAMARALYQLSLLYAYKVEEVADFELNYAHDYDVIVDEEEEIAY
jgi:hypothetical protein